MLRPGSHCDLSLDPTDPGGTAMNIQTRRTGHGARPALALAAAAVIAALGAPLLTAPTASAAAPTEATFTVAPGYQTWTVPSGVRSVTISVIGGAGGDGAV